MEMKYDMENILCNACIHGANKDSCEECRKLRCKLLIMENKSNEFTTADDVLTKYESPKCICGGYPECICKFEKNNSYIFYREEAISAMTEYSDLKCQPLLERINQLQIENEHNELAIKKALENNEALVKCLNKLSAKCWELQEAADKLAEAIQEIIIKHKGDSIENGELALAEYNKLKGK